MLCLFEMLNISRDAPLLDLGPWEELAVKTKIVGKIENFRNGNNNKKNEN